ncbi:MAG: OmpA family protein [Candidatus Cyclobacteriaceae bacterium M3_2C_046]
MATVINNNAIAQQFDSTQYERIKLTDVINSPWEESKPFFLESLNILFFARSNHPQNMGSISAGQDTWISNLTYENWSVPTNQFILNDSQSNIVIGISDNNGPEIFFIKYRHQGLKRYVTFHKATFQHQQWQYLDQMAIDPIEVMGGNHEFFMHHSGDILLMSYQGLESLGQEDLYVCIWDTVKGWSKPVHLGKTINTAGYEISPFLNHEGNRLYFASNGHQGYGGADIWYVEKKSKHNWLNWSEPKNLGKLVNSSGFDAYFSLTQHGEAFWASNRDGERTDIYWLRQKMLQNLEKKTKMVEIVNQDDFTLVINPEKVIFYPYDMAGLTNQARNELTSFIASLAKEHIEKIEIEAYTDDHGTERYNQKLAYLRALSVKDVIANCGISPELIKYQGKGVWPETGISPNFMRQARITVFYLYRRGAGL